MFQRRIPEFNPSTATLTHPGYAIAVGTAVFLAAWFFPPALYEQLIGERNYMHLDIRMFAFNAGCILLTIFGVLIGMRGTASPPRVERVASTTLDPYRSTSMSLLVLLIVSNLVSLGIFASLGGVSSIQLALRGDQLFQAQQREMIELAGGRIWLTALMLPSICAPLMYQMYRSQNTSGNFKLLFYIFAATYIISVFFSTRRNYISRPLFGCLLIYLAWPSRRMTLTGALTRIGLAVLFVLGAFLAFTLVRIGLDSSDRAVSEILRYLIAPYNTEALLIQGGLNLPGQHTGFYWTNWLWEFPLIDDLFSLEELRLTLLGPPSPHGALERGPILAHHGIYSGTAFPAFLCSYADFGWLGIVPFFFVGWISSVFWKSFLGGTVAGMLFYPAVAYSFVEWRANLLFPGDTMGYTLFVFFLIQLCCRAEMRKD